MKIPVAAPSIKQIPASEYYCAANVRIAGPMRRKYVTALVFCGLAIASNADDCVLPKLDPTNMPTGGEELREHVLGIHRYSLCHAEKDYKAGVRVPFPGLPDMLTSYNNRLKSGIKLWESRKSVPNAAQLREANAAAGLEELYVNYALGQNISEDLYSEADSGHPSPLLEKMRKEGKNPTQEAARMFAQTRFPPPDPWFTISRVQISRVDQDIALLRATEKLNIAKKRYEEYRQIHDTFRLKSDEVMGKWSELINQSTKKVQEYGDQVYKPLNPDSTRVTEAREQLLRAKKNLAKQTEQATNAESNFKKDLSALATTVAEAEQALSAATLEFVDVKSRGGGHIKSIESKDARLIPVSHDEQDALRNLILIVDAEIAGRTAEALEKDKARLAARERLKQAVAETEGTADMLAVAGVCSTIFQAHLELQSSALNLALASKGGPAGVLAEATSQLVGNAIAGPNYYDASGIGRDIPSIPRGEGQEEQSANWWDESGWQALRDQAKKEAAAIPFRAFNSYAKMEKADVARTIAQSEASRFISREMRNKPHLRPSTIDLPDGLASQLAKKEQLALKAAAEFGEATGKAGLRALVRSIGRDVLVSGAKELTKESLKKAAAELIEGGPLCDYMMAQLAIHEAYLDFTNKSDIYWANETAIIAARGRREGFLGRLRDGDLVIEKSGAFFPLPGYRFVLELAPGPNADPRRFRADVKLGEVELARDPKSTELAWIIPEGAKFGLELEEELEIKILIK